MLKTLSDSVGTEPFPTQGVETSGQFFKTADQKNKLVGLKVVIASEKIALGSTVYVTKQMQVENHWAKEVFDYQGLQVIFVPHNVIKVVDVE